MDPNGVEENICDNTPDMNLYSLYKIFTQRPS